MMDCSRPVLPFMMFDLLQKPYVQEVAYFELKKLNILQAKLLF
jgi:hypothetical protein